MERRRPFIQLLAVALWALVFAAALWFGPSRVSFRDAVKARKFVQDRRALLFLAGGLVGLFLYEVDGIEGTPFGEWISFLGFCAAVTGVLYGFRNWLRNRAA